MSSENNRKIALRWLNADYREILLRAMGMWFLRNRIGDHTLVNDTEEAQKRLDAWDRKVNSYQLHCRKMMNDPTLEEDLEDYEGDGIFADLEPEHPKELDGIRLDGKLLSWEDKYYFLDGMQIGIFQLRGVAWIGEDTDRVCRFISSPSIIQATRMIVGYEENLIIP